MTSSNIRQRHFLFLSTWVCVEIRNWEIMRGMACTVRCIAILCLLCLAAADVLFGLRTKFGVLMSSDGTVRAKSSFIIQQNHNWMHRLGKSTVLGLRGHPADSRAMAAKLQSACALHELEHGCEMRGRAISRYARHALATSNVDALIASGVSEYEENKQASDAGTASAKEGNLYWIHKSGLWYPVDYAAHGEEGRMLWSLLDRRYTKSLGYDEAMQLVQDCWNAVRTRSPRNLPGIKTVLVNPDGLRELDASVELEQRRDNRKTAIGAAG